MDLTVEDSVNDAFNSLIGRGTYPLSGARNPNFFGCIRLRSKLKKHQEYITLSQLTVFPQLFDTTNLSDITTLMKDGSKFPVENFDVGTSIAVECSMMAYKFTTQEGTLIEGYSVNLLTVHFLNSLNQNTSQPSTPKKAKDLMFSSPSHARQVYHNPSAEIDE